LKKFSNILFQHNFRLKNLFITLASLLLVVIFVFNSQATAVKAQDGVCQAAFQSVAGPLTELGNKDYIRMDGQSSGFSGGLYPQGSNQRPQTFEEAGMKQANEILPLNADGQPDQKNGRIGLVSIGMSNVNAEFDSFMKLAQDQTDINPHIIFINGALGGQTADKWVDPQALTWQELSKTLARYQVSPKQVQVVWIKETLVQGGNFPEKALQLQADLEAIVKNVAKFFPNIKIAYLSSRIYSYTYVRGLSPEPNAYETGFAVKWLIEKQIDGDPTLNYDPDLGAVQAPYLSWGPYLWADGQNPRADGLVWQQEDLASDCTHPSESGKKKVAAMLLDFFKNDTTSKPWFLTDGRQNIHTPPAEEITSTSTATLTATATPQSEPIATETTTATATITPTSTASPTTELQVTPVPETVSPRFLEKLWLWLQNLFS
jgi:hypothetical protein